MQKWSWGVQIDPHVEAKWVSSLRTETESSIPKCLYKLALVAEWGWADGLMG
jgi:hypothetical protein